MSEITLGPVLDQDDPAESQTPTTGEPILAAFGVHQGNLKLLCACLDPIRSEDVALGYHRCGRSIKVICA